MTAYDAARLQTPQKLPDLVIAPNLKAGDFFSHGIDCPFVFHHEGRLGMTVVGWDGIGYQTGLSWFDGERWSVPELIFGRDSTSTHRQYNSALTSVLRDNDLYGDGELAKIDGWFYGTYHAYPSPGYEEGPGVVGIARSRDLRSWEEFGTPLIASDGADWERGGLYKSWLMRSDGQFLLFYNAKDEAPSRWQEQTGLAVSDDMRTWLRVEQNPVLVNGPAGSIDDRFASDPCVLRDGATWVMFYFGLSTDGRARETFAWSRDLHTWTQPRQVLVDVGEAGSVDTEYAHKPAVITHEGRLEHYYCAVSLLSAPVDVEGYRQRELRGIALAHS